VQNQPESSPISAQHASSTIAHKSTPDIGFGIPYCHADVNPGNYHSSSNISLSCHVNLRDYFLASHHRLHPTKYTLPASNCSTGIPSIPGVVSSPLALQCTSRQLLPPPKIKFLQFIKPQQLHHITTIKFNRDSQLGSYERSQTRY
jgi:hypothetical protein